MKRMIVRKILKLLSLQRKLWCSLLKSSEHVVNNDVEWVVDLLASLYPYEKGGCLPRTKQGTLVL